MFLLLVLLHDCAYYYDKVVSGIIEKAAVLDIGNNEETKGRITLNLPLF